jgi:NAD(P)H-flavin reductase
MAIAVEDRVHPLLDPMVPQSYRVQRVHRETADTYTLELRPVSDTTPMMEFRPGQFNMLYLFGMGEVPISISGSASNRSTLVHTVRAVGSTTRAICALKRGDVVGVRGPFGRGWPLREAEGSDVVVVAGGIGLAPLRPAFYYLLDHRGNYGRVSLLYGARRPQEMLYVSELEEWRSRFDVDVEITVDNANSDWHANVGVVTKLIGMTRFDPEETVAIVCGPEVMMRFTVAGLLDRGVAPDNIYVSFERNMKCAIGFCGHCQYGPTFVCKDGPVFPLPTIERLMKVREI